MQSPSCGSGCILFISDGTEAIWESYEMFSVPHVCRDGPQVIISGSTCTMLFATVATQDIYMAAIDEMTTSH